MIERYVYDKAGNMVRKVIRGSRFVVRDGVETLVRDGEYRTTTFTFDDANQLVSSTCDGVTTRYEYDAAGRMIREGNRTYTYGYLDKVMSVRLDRSSANSSTSQPLNFSTVYTYTYHPDGQLATADYGKDGSEDFTWDGLALIQRGSEHFINEPHVGGGNPVVSSKGTSFFNDMLGTTVGAKSGAKYSAAALTAFGERLDKAGGASPAIRSLGEGWFTGKPEVAGLGHAFLIRNYRAGLAKWQTADPMGYPDGWNRLMYGVNSPVCGFDLYGAKWNSYEYRNIYFQTTYRDFCELPGGLPLDVGSVGLGFWQTVLNVFAGIGAEALVDYAKEVVLPLWKLYAAEFNITDPSQDICEQIMEEQGYGDWEFVGVEFFSGNSDAEKMGEVIIINRFDVTWKISMRKLNE